MYFPRFFSSEQGENNFNIVDSKAIAISSIPSSPPGIIISFESDSSLVVVNIILQPFQLEPDGDGFETNESSGGLISLSTMVLPGHRALLMSEKISPRQNVVGCTGGQGWSLIQTQRSSRKSFFICWDGATDTRGPYILPLRYCLSNNETNTKSVMSAVTPLMSYVEHTEKLTGVTHHESVAPSSSLKSYILPSMFQQDDAEGGEFSSGYMHKKSFSNVLEESIKMTANIDGGIDETIVNALHSISLPQQPSQQRLKAMNKSRSDRMKSSGLSHQEKSWRLLRRCPTWNQLDDTQSNHRIVHGQGKNTYG